MDTNICIYFSERHDRHFDAVVPFFQLLNDGLSIAYMGDAVAAESLYKPHQINDTPSANEFKAFFNNDEFITLLPHTKNVFEPSAELAPKRGMKPSGALHYAIAALAGCKFISANDNGFASSDAIEVTHIEGLLGK